MKPFVVTNKTTGVSPDHAPDPPHVYRGLVKSSSGHDPYVPRTSTHPVPVLTPRPVGEPGQGPVTQSVRRTEDGVGGVDPSPDYISNLPVCQPRREWAGTSEDGDGLVRVGGRGSVQGLTRVEAGRDSTNTQGSGPGKGEGETRPDEGVTTLLEGPILRHGRPRPEEPKTTGRTGVGAGHDRRVTYLGQPLLVPSSPTGSETGPPVSDGTRRHHRPLG